MSLREKLKVIKTLDSEIVEVVEETHLVDEIEQADLYKVRIYSTLIKIDRVVDSISKPMPAVRKPNVSTVPSAPPTHKVRLPKLTIKGGGPRKKIVVCNSKTSCSNNWRIIRSYVAV